MLLACSIEQKASEFGVPIEDVLLILLNYYGVATNIGSPRTRLFLRLSTQPDDPVFLILAFSRKGSPFEVEGQELFFQGNSIGTVFGEEDDDALLGYFRNGRNALTLNSNARSQCTGCVFCPNSLEHAADPFMKISDEITEFFSELALSASEPNIAFLRNIAVVTGCFCDESKAIDHLEVVDKAARANGFNGTLRFLSSVIRSPKGFDEIADRIGSPFHYSLTVECADNRQLILKDSKASLQVSEMSAVLSAAKTRGFDTDFTYIVGLDGIKTAFNLLSELIPLSTKFPLLQVYQPHNELMQQFVADEAKSIDYFLNTRQHCEGLLNQQRLKPVSWQNYRPLWYYGFAGDSFSCIRK